MKNVKIGLVTVLFNGDDVLEEFFISLSNQTFDDFKLYLVDNSHNNKSYKLLNELLTKYNLKDKSVYIDSGSNVGIAEGNNLGIKESLKDNTEYTLLLNNDISFKDCALLESMYNKAKENNITILVPKIYYYNSNKIWFIDGVFNHFIAGVIHLHDQIEDTGQFNDEREIDYAPTCFMLIANKVFHEIGIMDKSYFVYMDDVDFVYRAIQKGFKIYSIPSLTLGHKVGFSTGGSESEFSFKYSLRNRIYFARKYYNFPMKVIGLGYLFSAFLYKAVVQKRLKLYFEAIKSGLNLKVNHEINI